MADNDDIESCIRRVARELKTTEDVTVNKIRSQTEEELDLDAGYLKSAEWKERSKDIITAIFDEDDEPSPAKPISKKPAPKARAKPAGKAGTKRKSDDDGEEDSKQQKRRKKRKESDPEDIDMSLSELDEDDTFEEQPRKRGANKTARKSAVKKAARKKAESDDEDEMSDVFTDENKSAPEPVIEIEKSQPARTNSNDTGEMSDVSDKSPEAASQTNGKPAPFENDESEFSSVIDEPLTKKKLPKKAASEKKSKPDPKTTKAKAPAKVLTAEDEEIKRLQGYLIKCGVRKMWWKELAPYPTSREKIGHLKKMLEDVGMNGRFSAERARQIKEARELADELEAAKEFNDRWGQSEGEEDDSKGRASRARAAAEESQPKKRLPKGFVDFGDSGDEVSD